MARAASSKAFDRLVVRSSSEGHKLGQVCADASPIMQIVPLKFESRATRGWGNGAFDPQTLVLLETAFDEAWLTLKSTGNKTVKPDELARGVLRLAMEGGAGANCNPSKRDTATRRGGSR